MSSSVSSVAGRSPVTVAAGFLGAFIVSSLAVQLVRTQTAFVPTDAVTPTDAAAVKPVIASPATLWSTLGERDLVSETANTETASTVKPAAQVNVEPVVGSEATLWSTLGDR